MFSWPVPLLTAVSLAFLVLPSQAYDDMALVRYVNEIDAHVRAGASYDRIRSMMNIHTPEEFRAKHPDPFELSYSENDPEIKHPFNDFREYPTLPQVHDLMLKRFALDFHKLIHTKFERSRSDITYHTLAIVKAILNLPEFDDIDLAQEQES